MTGRRLGVGAAVVDGALVPGDVVVADGVIDDVGVVPVGSATSLAVPGFVDVQINGVSGIDFSATDLAGCRIASRALGRTGTTAILPTVPTAHPDRYRPLLDVLREACGADLPGARFLGVHLEGPFLSPLRAGAHNRAWLRDPDAAAVHSWIAAAPIAMMTLAPELAGAIELIRQLRDAGVLVSLGHTDATKPTAHAGFDAGATMVTHLWNAQRQPTSREPAVGGVGLARHDVHVGVICDLVHVDADTIRFTFAAAAGRFVAVTDAVAVAAPGNGDHRVSGRAVATAGGAVRLADGTLAGSTGTMDDTLRNLVGIGVPLLDALATMTTAPRRVLGTHARGCGRIAPGDRADVVVLDDALRVRRVLVGGDEVD